MTGRPDPRRALLAIVIAGGLAVLASYALAFSYGPEVRSGLWGDLPGAWRPVYTVSMLLAALGFFPLTYRLLFATEPDAFHEASGLGFRWVLIFYALVLGASALWLPLTAQMIRTPGPGLSAAVRLVLSLVAIGSLGLFYAVYRLARREGGALSWAAVAGAVFFCVQTVVLDALVWPAFFPR